MSRLIDYKKFKDLVTLESKEDFEGNEYILLCDLQRNLDKSSIVYNVDKVIEQLEECKKAYPLGSWCDMVEEAKYIVRKGGVDD